MFRPIPLLLSLILIAVTCKQQGSFLEIKAGAQEQEASSEDRTPYSLAGLLEGRAFVRVPAGEFAMGSANGNPDERPVHRVRISQDFEMGKFEVTQAQWAAVMGRAHGRARQERSANPSHSKGPTLPVENVSWNEVQQFLRALNARDKTHHYRLPTEAEWEYACRAGTTDDHAGSLQALAWFEDNAEGKTHPVGEKQPNAWGLHDMHGNVWEWVQDWYGFDYYEHSPTVDPRGPESGSYRVYRGGCWFGAAAYCRSAIRGFDFPGGHYYSVGFRLVRTPKP